MKSNDRQSALRMVAEALRQQGELTLCYQVEGMEPMQIEIPQPQLEYAAQTLQELAEGVPLSKPPKGLSLIHI